MDDITRGMLSSSVTAFGTIYLTLALLLTSFRVGLYALLPNLVPVAIYYGALGLTGTPLNLSTSLIRAITLGIAVDDTVHYFSRFALEARRLGDERRATLSTLRSVIRPVTFTTLGLCLGFLALTASELRSQVEFGILSAFTMAVALLLELTLSPTICASIRLVTLWDLLTLDLGHEPQRTIPLFEGLTKRQARIFALMSTSIQLPAGQRLIAEGDKGGEMYIVIDDELVASIDRKGKRVEFTRMKRGDLVGEIALFNEVRSADVDVIQDARVLRFGDADLLRMHLRYPQIAASVYANLNRILAKRVKNTLETLR
ncbi:MAG: cyclic nucleotide-binding domain-containing protein [Gammaproteobacteria bacterium]|nr:cyclic nucleotide-binding domain-containing protein [Gammaproteobacteria bacterium]